MDTINSRIAHLRKSLKLTRSAFGEEMGVSDSVIKNIEYVRDLIMDDLIKEMAKFTFQTITIPRKIDGIYS